jgi:quinol monooxygenase YgiN
MLNSPFIALWEFHVKPESLAAFEEIYGPHGDWAQLFGKSPDYLGTELIRDLNQHGRYLTLDRWISREALQRFKQEHQTAYSDLDKQCESLTETEMFLGDFEQTALRPNT